MKNSSLFNQDTFYKQFKRDLAQARHEVIIESPFITTRRMTILLPIFAKLRQNGISIVINTRDPIEHSGDYHYQALDAVSKMQGIGITVLYTVGHHRKLAIIDREVFYEGSLNIMAFNDSCEIMRRVVSTTEAKRLLKFIGIKKYARR